MMFGFVGSIMVDEEEYNSLLADAARWRWLREQGGWPETECEAMGQPPTWFDKLADDGMESDTTLAERA